MTTEKTKQTRTPRQYETIKTGALALTLKERGELRDALIVSIKEEAAKLTEAAKDAASIANGGEK